MRTRRKKNFGDFDKYSKVIIVDEKNRPMAWAGDQLCYCTNSDWDDEAHPLTIYTKTNAVIMMSRSRKFRKNRNMDVPDYKMIPVRK